MVMPRLSWRFLKMYCDIYFYSVYVLSKYLIFMRFKIQRITYKYIYFLKSHFFITP